MSIEKKKEPKKTTSYEKPLAIKGEFMDVFKVIKKHKEINSKSKKDT